MYCDRVRGKSSGQHATRNDWENVKCLRHIAISRVKVPLKLSDTAISDQAESSETHNMKIASDKATKTRSNLLWLCIMHNIIMLSSSLCRKYNVFIYPESAQTEQKHTTITFVWFPDHVLWYSVSWLTSQTVGILNTRTSNMLQPFFCNLLPNIQFHLLAFVIL